MSTLPHNTPNAGNVHYQAQVRPAAMPQELDAVVRHFVATTDGLGAPRPSSDELLRWTQQVAAVTAELFSGKLAIETGVDPEIRDDVCLLFQVETSGSVEDIVALNNAWHRHVVSVAPQWPGLFCLSINAQE